VKKPYFLLVLVFLVGVLFVLAVRVEGAGGKMPDLVLLDTDGNEAGYVWYDKGTTYSVIAGEVNVLCDCQFPMCDSALKTVDPDPSETPSETPIPTDPPITPSATPSPDLACNRGVGNGSEDCDPGNSYGKGGGGGRPAGEDREEGVLP
jgi:hypothetical protein